MTEQQFSNLKKLLKTCDIDKSGLSHEEISELLRALDVDRYTRQIEDFIQFLDKYKPLDDDEPEDFYDKRWKIEFNGKTVTLHNSQLVFYEIEGLLDEVLRCNQ